MKHVWEGQQLGDAGEINGCNLLFTSLKPNPRQTGSCSPTQQEAWQYLFPKARRIQGIIRDLLHIIMVGRLCGSIAHLWAPVWFSEFAPIFLCSRIIFFRLGSTPARVWHMGLSSTSSSIESALQLLHSMKPKSCLWRYELYRTLPLLFENGRRKTGITFPEDSAHWSRRHCLWAWQ